MSLDVRLVDEADILSVVEGLGEFRRTSKKQWLKTGKWDTAYTYLVDAAAGRNGSLCAMVGGIFVMYTVANSWCGTDCALEEQLVLRLYAGGNLGDVVQWLELEASRLQATGIIVGTALANSDRALVRTYNRHGFTQEAVALYKPTRK